MMTKIPKDPAILLGYINTQLRDYYPSLGELCAALGLDPGQVEEALGGLGYAYHEANNQFV